MNIRLFAFISLLVPGFLIPLSSDAQRPEGTIRYLVTHSWTKKMAAVDYLSKQQRERITYMWGGSRSEWKEYTTLYFSPERTRYLDSEELAEREMEGFSWRRDEYFIHRNFRDNTMHDIIKMLGKVYVIDDTLQAPNWKILNDIKEVAGHICMNAYWDDTLKMQKVTAWFALDIPAPGGPERYYGLPGLILEVDVNNGAMLITTDKLEMKPLATELDLPKKMKGKKIHENDYRAILSTYFEDRRKAEEPPFWGIRY